MASAEENLKLIMVCLKHTEGRPKPDFDAAAAELGTDAKKLYHRHWALLKKWGMTGSKAADAGSAVADADATPPKTPTARKRGRQATRGGSTCGKTKKNKLDNSVVVNGDDTAADAEGNNDSIDTPTKGTSTKKVVKDEIEDKDDVDAINADDEVED